MACGCRTICLHRKSGSPACDIDSHSRCDSHTRISHRVLAEIIYSDQSRSHRCQINKKIVLTWEAAPEGDDSGNYDTTVTMVFEPLDDNTRTLVSITEEGWKQTETGLKSSYGNCEGWTGMLTAMKAYVEHGINLREGFYK